MSTTAQQPVTTPIPVQLAEPEFEAFILPHLSMPKRGPKCKSRSREIRGRIADQANKLISHFYGLGAHLSASNFPGAAFQQQHAQPVAHLRECQGRRQLLTPVGFTEQEPHRDQGQPCGRTREEKRHHRSPGPRDAMPTRRSSFRLLAMASPHGMLTGSN